MTATCLLDATTPRAHLSVRALLDTRAMEETAKVELTWRNTSESRKTSKFDYYGFSYKKTAIKYF